MTRLSLQARQTTGLVMTAELQQAIGLLQLSNQELLTELTALAEANPLLVVGPPDGEAAPPESPLASAEEMRGDDLPDDLTRDESDWREASAWEDDPLLRHGTCDSEEAEHTDQASRPESGTGLFLEQIRFAFTDQTDRAIALALLEALDETGRLDTTIAQLAGTLRVSPTRIDSVRSRMLDFEPPGCFAFTLAECLAAQFRARNRYDPAVATMLDHLDWLARGEHERLRKACGLDAQDYAELLRELRSCDPRPGTGLGPHTPEAEPDLFIHQTRDGPVVTLNQATWPSLTVDERLYQRLMQADAQARSWTDEKHAQARSILRVVEQRARSLLLVCQAIATHQSGFLSDGASCLRPLTLSQVAMSTGLHESTVSRVTATRSIGTPLGVLPLRRFFSTGLGESEDQTSAESVRSRIRQIISTETGEAIMSDEAITQQLQESGIAIQRRTVAKYREALGIAGSAQRRREFRMKSRLTG